MGHPSAIQKSRKFFLSLFKRRSGGKERKKEKESGKDYTSDY